MDRRETISPDMGQWQSPEELPTSTPTNEGSSRQDSGYSSSATPRSAHSRSPSPNCARFCRFCRKRVATTRSPVHNRLQSTPVFALCTCRNISYTKVQSPFECLMTIKEGEVTPTPIPKTPLSLWQKREESREIDSDSMMETSLYPDPEPEPGSETSAENECAVNAMDISDETSIDFSDRMFATPSTSAAEDKINVIEPAMKEIGNYEPTKSLVILPPKTSKKDKLVPLTKMIGKVLKYNKVVNTLKFCMRGIEHVDFLFQLTEKYDLSQLVEIIFSHLSEKDLNNVSLVSTTWKKCVEKDKKAFERLNFYKTKMLLRKENYTSPTKSNGSSGGRRDRPALGALLPITNQLCAASSPRRSPPISPASARHRHARQVATTVRKGDRMLKCPRCEFLVPDHGRSPSAQCRRSGCRHRFCVYCRGEVGSEGPPHDCPPLLTPRSATKASTKVHPVGSKSGKRNLRRTLLGQNYS